MKNIKITTTKKQQVIDITENITKHLPETGKGICQIFLQHTTAALTVAELDPGSDLDLLDALREIVPQLNYRHPHDPTHMPDHILSSLVGVSLNVPFENGKLMLGTWQSVVLLEFDGPRERSLIITHF